MRPTARAIVVSKKRSYSSLPLYVCYTIGGSCIGIPRCIEIRDPYKKYPSELYTGILRDNITVKTKIIEYSPQKIGTYIYDVSSPPKWLNGTR